jgi:hypothetical protein
LIIVTSRLLSPQFAIRYFNVSPSQQSIAINQVIEIESNDTVELGVVSLADDAYASSTEFLRNFVVRDGRRHHDDPFLVGDGNIYRQTATVLC